MWIAGGRGASEITGTTELSCWGGNIKGRRAWESKAKEKPDNLNLIVEQCGLGALGMLTEEEMGRRIKNEQKRWSLYKNK